MAYKHFKLSGREYRVRRDPSGNLELFEKLVRDGRESWEHVFDTLRERRIYERFVAETLHLTKTMTLELPKLTHSETVREGLHQASVNGVRLGRPKKDLPKKKILQMRKSGVSMKEIAEKVGCGRSTIYRFLSQRGVS